MYCTQCGVELPSQARFCLGCGVRQPGVREDLAPKRLFRLPHDKKILGICAGFARYLDVDVTMIRILTVAVVCITGFLPGIIAYLFAWLIMPVEPVMPRSLPAAAPVT